jgi:hypothetical protein
MNLRALLAARVIVEEMRRAADGKRKTSSAQTRRHLGSNPRRRTKGEHVIQLRRPRNFAGLEVDWERTFAGDVAVVRATFADGVHEIGNEGSFGDVDR